MRLAREALTLARSTRDPEALSLVLTRSWALVDGSSPYVTEMEPLLDEAESVARDAGNPAALSEALRNKAFLAGCRGDGTAFAAHLAATARINDGLRRPELNWWTRNDAAALAVFTGDLDRAEQLATEALELGRLAGRSDEAIIAVFGALIYLIRMSQGRSGELVPLVEARVEASPDVPVWRMALAGALAESDRVDEARVHFEWLAEDDWARVPRDVEYCVTMGGLGLMTYPVRPPEAITRDLYDRLTPFAGLFNWTGPTLTDPNDLSLAMTAATLQQHDTADGHFAAAIALCEGAGARAYLARSHFEWARILADRGDATRARDQASIALELGTEIGMTGPHGVVPRAQALLEPL
jgi:hypothetical protein